MNSCSATHSIRLKTPFTVILLALFLFLTAPVKAQINESLARGLASQTKPVLLELESAGIQAINSDSAPEFIKSDPAMRLLLRQFQDTDGIAETRKSDPDRHPYNLRQINGEWWVGVFLKVREGSGSGFLSAIGARNITVIGSIVSAEVPVQRIPDLARLDQVQFIETAGRRNTLNTQGRISINADKVHNGTDLPRAYHGEGVVVGVIDSGIDFTHPDFSDNNGSRIQYLYEYTGTSQLEWSKQQIDTQPELVTQRDLDDGVGHGTHVAGTAAGGGRHNSEYTGIAPKSDIIFVKGMVNGGFSDNNVIGGSQYIFEKAAQMGKPAVINLSLGSNFGPLDGTSLYEQALSDLTGPGKIIVAAAGNEGFDLIHAGGTLSPTTRYATFILANNPGQSAVNMWYKPGVISQVAVAAFVLDENQELFFLGSSEFVPAGGFMDYTPIQFEQNIVGYIGVDAQTTADPRNGDGNIQIEIVGDPENNVNVNEIIWTIVYDTQTQGKFDMWAFGGEFWPSIVGIAADFPGIVELPGNSNSTVGSPASAEKIISVGSYVTTNSWTDIDNQARQWGNPDPTRQTENQVVPQIGQKSYFSSVGPTRDGRIAPDISAPGELIFSPLSSHLTEGQGYQRYLVLQGGKYVASQGTSMASPHVAGVVALMLQINPELTYEQVLDILRETARTDSFTGSVPNNLFGYGKVDAYEAVRKTIEIYGAPGGPSATLRYFDPESEQRLIILDSFAPVDSGFVFGTNRYLDMAKASVFTLPEGATEGQLSQVNVWFGYRQAGLTSESYNIAVYNGNASAGPAGAPIASQQFLMKDVNSDNSFASGKEPTVHIFDEPVTVPSTFFVSVEFGTYNNSGVGRAAIMATEAQGRRIPEVWEKWSNGSWNNVSDAWFGQSGNPGNNGWYMWMEAELGTTVDVTEENPEIPSLITLEQNYPNPFNPETRIRFSLPEVSDVSIDVYDVLGRHVTSLADSRFEAGTHSVAFNGSALGSGIYFYRMQAGSTVLTRKMMLLK
jgi:minor extracellular serine protease Vpr